MTTHVLFVTTGVQQSAEPNVKGYAQIPCLQLFNKSPLSGPSLDFRRHLDAFDMILNPANGV